MSYVDHTARMIRNLGAAALIFAGAALAQPPAPPHSAPPQSPPSEPTTPPEAEARMLDCEGLAEVDRLQCEQRNAEMAASRGNKQGTEEEQAAREDEANATEAESDADVAGEKPAPGRIRQATSETEEGTEENTQSEDSHRQEQHEDSNSETDSLGPPPG